MPLRFVIIALNNSVHVIVFKIKRMPRRSHEFNYVWHYIIKYFLPLSNFLGCNRIQMYTNLFWISLLIWPFQPTNSVSILSSNKVHCINICNFCDAFQSFSLQKGAVFSLCDWVPMQDCIFVLTIFRMHILFIDTKCSKRENNYPPSHFI